MRRLWIFNQLENFIEDLDYLQGQASRTRRSGWLDLQIVFVQVLAPIPLLT